MNISFDLKKKMFVRGHSYCRMQIHVPYLRKLLTGTYQFLHSSINDKSAVQAKHIKKFGIPVLLHRIVMEVQLNWKVGQKKNRTAITASSARRKAGSFQKRKVSLFLQWSSATHHKSLTIGIIASP